MTKLKPCPFCGGKAHILQAENGAWHVTTYCGADKPPYHNAFVIAGTKAEAVKEWNTRAERTCTLIPTRGKKYRPHVPTLTCSNCGAVYELAEVSPSETLYGFAYCSNCGAKVVDE